MTAIRFPKNFLWGAATAAYQIEGAVSEDGRGPTIWDSFCRQPGAVLRGDNADIACDHYHRWPQDLDLLEDLGVGAYRFSVAWARVFPEGSGKPNQAGLDFYERLTDSLLERGIKPMVTLYHWDLPQALQETGGWADRATVGKFADYAATVAERLGDRVDAWITLNEPYCSAFVGYVEGRHAPGIVDEATAVQVLHHLLVGHGLAAAAIRDTGARGGVGLSLNLTSPHPASSAPEDLAAHRRLDLYENRMFLDPVLGRGYPADAEEFYRGVTDFGFVRPGDLELIATPLDFLGVNYYERHLVEADPGNPRGWRRLPDPTPTISGIGVHPEGLGEVLDRVSGYTDLPLLITETGIALHDYVDPSRRIHDQERIDFYEGHIRAAAAAIDRGVNLVGFFPWSFMDNFEWAWGYGHRFGLYYVDYATQERIPKDSASWYARLTRANGLD